MFVLNGGHQTIDILNVNRKKYIAIPPLGEISIYQLVVVKMNESETEIFALQRYGILYKIIVKYST